MQKSSSFFKSIDAELKIKGKPQAITSQFLPRMDYGQINMQNHE
jgi:hypothetical protein